MATIKAAVIHEAGAYSGVDQVFIDTGSIAEQAMEVCAKDRLRFRRRV